MSMMNNLQQHHSGGSMIARLFHVGESRAARRSLLQKKMNYNARLPTSCLRDFVLSLRQKKKYLLKARRSRVSPPLSSSSKNISKILIARRCRKSKIVKQRLYLYKPIDGYKYGLLLWLLREEDDLVHKTSLHYQGSIHFMQRLRTGLFIKRRWKSEPWYVPCFHFLNPGRNTTTTNNIPVGLGAVIAGLGIPDSCAKAMLRKISHFTAAAHNNNYDGNLTLVMEIQIATLQLEGEDVLDTRLRSQVDGYCRSIYMNRILLKEDAHHQLVSLMHIQDAVASSSSYSYSTSNINLQVQEEGDCCSICLEELREGGGGCVYLPCSHAYHCDCIFKWMSNYNACPLCRHPYRRISI